MMSKKKLIIISVYLLLITVIILHYIGVLFVKDICHFFYDKRGMIFRLLLLFISIPLLGFLAWLLLNLEKSKRYIFIILIPFVTIFSGLVLESKEEKRQLFNHDLVVRKAYIDVIYTGNPSKWVIVNLKGLKHDFRWQVDIKKYKWHNLKEGDSLLVIYAKDCTVLHQVYELYPTKAQFEQFEKNPNYDKHWNK